MAGRKSTHWRRTAVAGVSAAACALGLTAAYASAAQTSATASVTTLPIYLDTRYPFDVRAADLVSRMTLTEKVQQLHTNGAPAIPRLGVQAYTYWSEGQHGINTLGADSNNGGAQGGVHATSFPSNFASSMSWDRNLMYQETSAISDEARGFLDKSLWGVAQNNLGPSASDYGSLTFWAPTVNLDRDPRWGRTDEAFGEDPYFVGQMAGQFVDGYEGNTQSGQSSTGYLKVAATAKHYALNNTEDNRTGISSNASDTDIRDYYTKQFQSLIEDSKVSGLMTSYNAINGTPSVADTYTTNQIAQRTYGFGGYITSDCGAVGTTYQNFPSGHDWAAPGWTTDNGGSAATWTNTADGTKIAGQAGGEAYALRAGTDLNCTGDEATLQNVEQAINAGVLSEGVIDQDLVRIFTVRMETGEFDPASKVKYTQIDKSQIQSAAHQQLAQKVADNSLVLLQNNNVAGTSSKLLPADPSKLNKVVILGNQANEVNLGNYSGEPTLQVNAVQGITNQLKAANPNATIVFDAANTSTTTTSAAVLSSATQAAIKNADLVILFVGTDHGVADEGKDRTTIAMPGNYDSLIQQTAALGNPKMALVIQSGGPVTIANDQGQVPAILFSGFNGESQGTALADVLFGKQNPSGHLNFTWYKDDSQLPPMSDYNLAPSDTGGLGRTYQYFTGTPTYPFGYGLSYSNFRYSNVAVDRNSVTADGTVKVGVDVANTGSTAGATVAEVYAATPFTVPGVELPKKRLAGFGKTSVLKPGQTQHFTIPVKISDLSLWDAQNMKSAVYDGNYQFQVGADSSDIAATKTVKVTGGITPKIQYVTVQPEAVLYKAGQSFSLTGKNHWIKDDTGTNPQGRNMSVTADNIIEAVNNDESFVDLGHAHVTYRSSNPDVATVSSAGIVKAVGDGAAQISVTVNGVTGTAPIVVGDSLTLAAQPIVEPGASATATTSFVNGGSKTLTNVAVTVTPPAGWTATATSPSTFGQVAGGQTVTTSWKLTAPANAVPGNFDLAAQVTFTGGSDSAATQTSIPYPSFVSMFDNAGVSDDTAPTQGNLDGGGLSYSAQTLAAAGLTPGGTFTHDGSTFTWSSAASGTPDNVVASGQPFQISGSGSKLGFLGTGDYGNASGTGTVVYTDGTAQTYSLTFADWWSASAAQGGDIAATLPYINNPGGKQNQTVHLYYASVPLQAGKTVQAVLLPDVSPAAVTGGLAMHVFAVAIN